MLLARQRAEMVFVLLRQIPPLSAAHNAARRPAGEAHRDVIGDQEPGLGHANAGLRELQPVHICHRHHQDHEVQCGRHGLQHAGAGESDRSALCAPAHHSFGLLKCGAINKLDATCNPLDFECTPKSVLTEGRGSPLVASRAVSGLTVLHSSFGI